MKDQVYKNWVKTVAKSSKSTYDAAWQSFLEYLREVKGKIYTSKQLLDLIVEDRKKSLEEQGEIESLFVDWALWLKSEYELSDHGGSRTKINKKGASGNTIKTYAGGIKSFFSFYGYPLSKRRARLPNEIRLASGKLENIKIEYRPEQVKKLLSVIEIRLFL
jgi:hypothetical protein